MKKLIVCLALVVFACSFIPGCEPTPPSPVATSGVSKTSVKVPTGTDGLTAEQRNIRDRLVEDNKPGSVKHLYIISAYSGQVILYSTVRGKITSSGKRLSPTSIWAGSTGGNTGVNPITFEANGYQLYTNEMIQDDGSYGSSNEYIFWWSSKGTYHQHYIAGGQIVHVSSEPIAVKSVLINVELSEK